MYSQEEPECSKNDHFVLKEGGGVHKNVIL